MERKEKLEFPRLVMSLRMHILLYFALCLFLLSTTTKCDEGEATTADEKIISAEQANMAKIAEQTNNHHHYHPDIFNEAGLTVSPHSKAIVHLGGGFGVTKTTGSTPKPLMIALAAGYIMAMRDLNESYSSKNIEFKMAMGDTHSTFTAVIQVAMTMGSTVFNGAGVHGFVGTNQSYTTEGADYILQDTDTVHIAYGANDSALSHNTVFPAFLRMYPSTAYEGYVLAQLCFSQFNWRRVVVVYSTDTYGVDAYAEFSYYASHVSGAVILDAIPVTANAALDFTDAFSSMRRYDPRIFVLLIASTTQAAQFMADGYTSGVLGSKSVVLGASPVFAWGQFLSTSYPLNMTTTDLHAQAALTTVTYLGLQVGNNDWRATDRGKAWMKRYAAQEDTITPIGRGKFSCQNATDDTGLFNLYKSCSPPTKCVCTGQQFSTYAEDGWNVAAMYLIPYVYDATFVLAYGVLNYSAATSGSGHLKVPSRISGRALKNTIVQNVSFEGITGHVAFSPGRDCLVSFGKGDRSTGIRYAVMNLQYSTSQWTPPSSGGVTASPITTYGLSLQRVGTWASEGGYTACENDPLLADSTTTNVTGGCFSPMWIAGAPSVNGATQLPSDRADPVILSMPDSMRGVLAALGAAQLFGISLLSVALVRYRKSRLLKASQPSLMWLVVFAGVLGAVTVLLFQTPVSDAACMSIYWIGHLTYLIGVSALLVKTLRVHLVVNARSMRRVKFTTRKALMLVAAIVLTVCAYMAIANGLGPPEKGEASVVEETGQTVRSFHCRVPNQSLQTALYSLEFMLLAVSGKLCYDTKDVPDAVNEAHSIMRAIFAIIVVCACGFAVAMAAQIQTFYVDFTLGVCFFLACTSSMAAYFGPKVSLLLKGADLNDQFKIVLKKPVKNGGNKVVVATRDGSRGESSQHSMASDATTAADHKIMKNIASMYIQEAPNSIEHCQAIVDYMHEIMFRIEYATSSSADAHLAGGAGAGGAGHSNNHSTAPHSIDILQSTTGAHGRNSNHSYHSDHSDIGMGPPIGSNSATAEYHLNQTDGAPHNIHSPAMENRSIECRMNVKFSRNSFSGTAN